MAEKKEDAPIMDAKGMLKEHSEKRTKIFYGERKKVEIITDTKFFKKGKVINPHKVMAYQLIKDKIAKEVR